MALTARWEWATPTRSRARSGCGAWTRPPGTTSPLRADGRSGRGVGLADMIEAIAEDRPHRASGAFAYHVLDVLLATEAAAEAAAPDHLDDRPARIAPGRPPALSD